MKNLNKFFMILVYVATAILVAIMAVLAYDLVCGYSFDPSPEALAVMITCIVIDFVAIVIYDIIPDIKFFKDYFKSLKG